MKKLVIFLIFIYIMLVFKTTLYSQNTLIINKVKVSGTSTLSTTTELIELDFNYSFNESTNQQNKLIEQERLLNEVLQKFNIPKENLYVYNFSANGYEGSFNFSKIKNKEIFVYKSYKLKTNKIDQAESLIYNLVLAGADNVIVSNIYSTKSDSIKNESLKLAFQNAKFKAQIIASQSGQTLGNVLFSEEILTPKNIFYEYTKNNRSNKIYNGVMENSNVGETHLNNVKKITITTNLNVEFELK